MESTSIILNVTQSSLTGKTLKTLKFGWNKNVYIFQLVTLKNVFNKKEGKCVFFLVLTVTVYIKK